MKTNTKIATIWFVACVAAFLGAIWLHSQREPRQIELSPIDTLHSELKPLYEDSLAKFRILDAKMYEAMDSHAPGDTIRKYLILSEDIKPKTL